MKVKSAFVAAFVLSCAVQAWAQAPQAVPLASEPRHHLFLSNDYVNVYRVEIAPHDSSLLHRHDHDYLFIAIGPARVTSAVPGKPDVHLDLADGDVRFSRGGFAHVARNDGDSVFHVVAIELLRPQGDLRNLCLKIVPAGSVDCPGAPQPAADARHTDWPEFQTDETRVILTRVKPHSEVALRDPRWEELIVALDQASLGPAVGKSMERLLNPGAAVWLGRGGMAWLFKNGSDAEVRFITLELQPNPSSEAAPPPANGQANGPAVGRPPQLPPSSPAPPVVMPNPPHLP
jgi:quercetin dioxygenase-like cupin family protein